MPGLWIDERGKLATRDEQRTDLGEILGNELERFNLKKI